MSALYLCIPLKRTWEVDLVKPLKTFMSNSFPTSGGESSDHTAALTDFNKLRNTMITKQVDKHESALEVLYRYYDQLVAIEGKFPIAENQVRISFKWQDAFDKESLFSGKRVLSVASGSYERVCVLFNIGALQSQVAEAQNLTSDDGLKLAAKLFQQSSGAYAFLKDIVLSSVPADPTPDLQPDALNALSALMLAQAQDCFVRKAMNDNMKPGVVAKLAFQCAELYADAMKLLQLESIRGLWPKDWVNSISGKQAGFHSIAEYYQSMVSKEAKDFGEEIARLRHAKDLMGKAESRGGASFKFSDLQKKIARDLQACEKDNDFIYHSKIPEVNALSAIGKAVVAKPTTLTPPLSGAQFKDLFERVVPLAVHQAVAGFEGRRSEIINGEVGRLREATQHLNCVLASLNLPSAIEDVSGSGQVPQSVLEKAATIRQMGGIDQLNRLFNDLPELLTRNKEILDESEKLLVEEEQSDQQLKAQFKERWTRTPSATLTESIKAELSKYRTIISNAVSADKIVRDRYNTHRACIELLSKSDADIQASLPSASPAAALQSCPAVAELRKLMESVEGIKAERDVTEAEIKDAPSDMTSKFITALSQDGAINPDELSVEQLERVYGPLRQQVTDSVRRQEALLEQIQRANMEFSQARVQNQSGASREEKLKDFASAYDNYVELKGNLEEGTKFYNDLTQLLVRFQSKVSDFCFARKTEKDELMKDLSAGIARQPGAPTPAAPAYQAPTVEGSGSTEPQRVAPARPPPPKIPAAAATPAQPAMQSYTVPPAAPGGTAPPASAPYGAPPGAPAQGAAPPYPTAYGAMPYPTYSVPNPVGYNPYMNYGYQQPPQGYPQGGYPQQQTGYPPQQPGYPPQQHGYPPQQPGYPGYPNYPAQPGYQGYPGYQQPR